MKRDSRWSCLISLIVLLMLVVAIISIVAEAAADVAYAWGGLPTETTPLLWGGLAELTLGALLSIIVYRWRGSP